MIRSGLIVYPKRGFLNSEYKIYAIDKDSFVILFNGQKIFDGTIEQGETKVLPKFHRPGEYVILSDNACQKQMVYVEDALRLGTSSIKDIYIFDNFPYVIFAMMDRIHFYDPSIESFVFTENFLSPNVIGCISEKKLLFITNHKDGISIGVFDLDVFSVTVNIEVSELIAHSGDFSKLYIKDDVKKSICVIDTEQLTIDREFMLDDTDEISSFGFDEGLGLLYITSGEMLYVIDVETNNMQHFEKKRLIGITPDGYLISSKYGHNYEYNGLKPNLLHVGTFTYNPLIPKLKFDGVDLKSEYEKCFPQTPKFKFKGIDLKNNEWEKHFDTAQDEIPYDQIKSDFSLECKAKIDNNDKSSKFVKQIYWDYISAKISFSPSNNGVYVSEKIARKYASSITYYVDTGRVSNPNIERKNRLLWISNQGFEVCYANNNTVYNDISIRNGKAVFAIKQSYYLILEDGRIASITMTNEENDAKTKDASEIIVINGEVLCDNEILCRSKTKLVRKKAAAYILCVLGDNSEWREIKVIVFKEEKHTRAQMSDDGKYLVYSKEGDKYALYNIGNQREETVFTGKFDDIDAEGRIIFCDSYYPGGLYRQLRIYDPINNSWEIRSVACYDYLSPDGKLYAKSSLKNRYFSMLTGKEITFEEYVKYDMPRNCADDVKEKIIGRRKALVEQHEDYFAKKHCGNQSLQDWIDKTLPTVYCFSDMIHQKKDYVVIGVVGTDNVAEIELSTKLDYLNYIAFSHNNKYVGIVGKPGLDGYLKLVRINYEEHKDMVSIEKEICDNRIARKATWICSFTKNGFFGTYDSSPDMYLIHEDDFEKFDEENANDTNFAKITPYIKGRSLLCFSPSGKLMALSNQGYQPISLGGEGHLPSNNIYIYSIDARKELSSWADHGERIAFGNTAKASFSIDESKLMTVSVDGVVIVRNISEKLYASCMGELN